MYQNSAIPPEWSEGSLTHVLKPGKDLSPQNCRPIAVTPLPNRILSKMVARRIESWYNFHDDQFGFREKRSTLDAIFVLNSVLEAEAASGRPVCIAFIDFSSAFDTVNHSKLWQKMAAKGASSKLLNFLMTSYEQARNRVKWDGKTSKAYPLQKGVRQGEPTSGVLFNLYLDDPTEAVNKGRVTTIK